MLLSRKRRKRPFQSKPTEKAVCALEEIIYLMSLQNYIKVKEDERSIQVNYSHSTIVKEKGMELILPLS